MILLALALAPALAIMIYIYIKDKYEREPIGFLLKNFGLGATASIIITLIIGTLLQYVFPTADPLSISQQFFKAFIIVALVEEFSKYIIVIFYAQSHKEFDEPFDGIVYAVMVSMGFAALENVSYVFQFGMTNGIVRAFTAVPAHATFGIIMGYYMGKAKFATSKREKIKMNLIGLFAATLFHGAYDFFLFINFIPGISIGAFVSLFIGIFLSRKAIKKHQEISRFKH
ncbi:MAG: PrsW family glutamic-type intramembrane protease [Polaribacter sp.]|nr:PrsW family glutamic-type intramembrane protease [Polaribacter sp.]MDG1811032.1 PrsW family glutamic-type intramembrane protease [Polaribacter sp.]MDG1994429.1 PrsW family glutamic-type intramembrane protease [Polaribacter sp.]